MLLLWMLQKKILWVWSEITVVLTPSLETEIPENSTKSNNDNSHEVSNETTTVAPSTTKHILEQYPCYVGACGAGPCADDETEIMWTVCGSFKQQRTCCKTSGRGDAPSPPSGTGNVVSTREGTAEGSEDEQLEMANQICRVGTCGEGPCDEESGEKELLWETCGFFMKQRRTCCRPMPTTTTTTTSTTTTTTTQRKFWAKISDGVKQTSCVGGQMNLLRTDGSWVPVHKLEIGDIVQGINGKDLKKSECTVHAVVKTDSSRSVYNGFTQDHFVMEEKRVAPHGVKGKHEKDDVYTIFTSCDLVVNVNKIAFTPISETFCAKSLDLDTYLEVMQALRSIVDNIGIFWFDLDSYKDNEDARLERWEDSLPMICKSLVECVKKDDCNDFELLASEFVRDHVKPTHASEVYTILPNLGHYQTRGVSQAGFRVSDTPQSGTFSSLVRHRPSSTQTMTTILLLGSICAFGVALTAFYAVKRYRSHAPIPESPQELEHDKNPPTHPTDTDHVTEELDSVQLYMKNRNLSIPESYPIVPCNADFGSLFTPPDQKKEKKTTEDTTKSSPQKEQKTVLHDERTRFVSKKKKVIHQTDEKNPIDQVKENGFEKKEKKGKFTVSFQEQVEHITPSTKKM